MMRQLLLQDVSLWSCLWQSTVLLALGLVAAWLLRARPSRAYPVLLLAMVLAVLVPCMSEVVRHLQLGVLPAQPQEASYLPVGTWTGGLFEYEVAMAHGPAPRVQAVAQPAGGSGLLWRSVLLYGWLAITLVLLGRIVLTFAYGVHLVRHARASTCEHVRRIVDQAGAKLQMAGGLDLRTSRRIGSPVIWCWTRPPILLMPECWEEMSIDWRGVVAHELAHCKRADHLTGLLAELTVSLLPWHPLIWLSKRWLLRLGEHACDDWAVAMGEPSEDYAESLLRFRPHGQMAFLPAVVHSRKGLAGRIHRILSNACADPRTGPQWLLATGIVAVVLGVSIAFAQTRPAAQEPTTSPSASADHTDTPDDRQATLPARTFNSDLPFRVSAITIREGGQEHPEFVGTTPAEEPLRIPECVYWFVEPHPDVNMDRVWKEVQGKRIPGLKLPSSISDADLAALEGLTGLKWLSLEDAQITDAGLAHLQGLKTLESLNLLRTGITDAGLVYLKNMTRLQVLTLAVTGITDAGVAHLRDLQRLRLLYLGQTQVTDIGLEHLKGMQELEQLYLNRTAITGEGFAQLGHLDKLRRLHLGGTQVTDAALVYLKELEGLEYLVLFGVQITDAGLATLSDMPTLRALSLDSTGITDLGLMHLKDLDGLNTLLLSNTQITDAGLEHLENLQELQVLSVDDTPVRDAGLAHLKALTKLKWLHLNNTQITDVGLVHLRALDNLLELNIRGTPVTNAGVDELKQWLPHTDIIY